jgi:hypothetical protein
VCDKVSPASLQWQHAGCCEPILSEARAVIPYSKNKNSEMVCEIYAYKQGKTTANWLRRLSLIGSFINLKLRVYSAF